MVDVGQAKSRGACSGNLARMSEVGGAEGGRGKEAEREARWLYG